MPSCVALYRNRQYACGHAPGAEPAAATRPIAIRPQHQERNFLSLQKFFQHNVGNRAFPK